MPSGRESHVCERKSVGTETENHKHDFNKNANFLMSAEWYQGNCDVSFLPREATFRFLPPDATFRFYHQRRRFVFYNKRRRFVFTTRSDVSFLTVGCDV